MKLSLKIVIFSLLIFIIAVLCCSCQHPSDNGVEINVLKRKPSCIYYIGDIGIINHKKMLRLWGVEIAQKVQGDWRLKRETITVR